VTAKRIAVLAVATATFAASATYIALSFEWRAALGMVLAAQPAWFFLGGSVAILGYWLTRAFRWSYLMRGMDNRPAFSQLYLCSAVALSLSVFTPLQAGEALKVELLRKHAGGTRLAGYSAFLIERAADLYVVGAMAAIALATPLVAVSLLALPIAGWWLLRRAHPGVGSPRSLTVVLAATALGWMIVALGWMACLRSVSIRLDLPELLGLVSLVTLASIFSFIPAGLGVADASAAALLIRHGVEPSLAQAGALALRGFSLLIIALGALHLLALRRRGRRQGTL
jgi:uncharacterized membrane protein YbhN (UPF0104 family)